MALVLVGGPLAPAAVASTSTVVASAEESTLLALTNDARSLYGLAPLADDLAARGIARAWSTSMASNGLSHNPNIVGQVVDQVTSSWTRIGENVGEGSSVTALQAAFMASAPHRDNVLGSYDRVGVGAVRDGGGTLWVTLVFISGPELPYVSPSSWDPYPTPSDLASRQYWDFLGYFGAPDGIDYWSTLMRSGLLNGVQVTGAFMGSEESVSAFAPVVRLYSAYFLRMPDHTGLAYWVGSVRQGMTPAAVSQWFADSTEFTDTYGSPTNGAFVDLVYRNVLHRPPDDAGRAYWVAELVSGRSNRGDVMIGFSESSEYKVEQSSEVAVSTAYNAMLDRVPDQAGFDFWVGALDGGAPVTSLLGSIFATGEYRNRVD